MSFVFEPVCNDFRKKDDEIPGGVDPFLSERLPWAAVHGDLPRVQECSIGGANINERGREKRTALIEASCYGRLSVVEFLIAQSPAFNVKDTLGRTALMHAAENGHHAVCLALVNSKRVDMNTTDLKKWTALMFASAGGHADIVAFLVSAHADINTREAQNKTALELAGTQNRQPGAAASAAAVRAALEGERARVVREVVLEGARKGYSEVIVKSLEKGATHLDLSHALLAAASSGHVYIVEQLLQAKANINFQTAPQLVEHDPSGQLTPREGQQSGSALLLAASAGHLQVLDFLIESQANVNQLSDDGSVLAPDRGISPLWVACKNGYVEEVRSCIQAAADLEVKDWDSTTPLIVATKEGHDEVVELLLQVGANVFSQDVFGRTAGDMALLHQQWECAKLLLPAKEEPPATALLEFVPRVKPKGPLPQEKHALLASIDRVFGDVVKDIEACGADTRSSRAHTSPPRSDPESRATSAALSRV